MRSVVAAILMCTPTAIALAHGGGLNAEGCHHNRKTGDYHSHRAPSIAAAVQQQQAGQQGVDQATQRATSAPLAAVSSGPTCHVGPRGGTYTITKSARKNYSDGI